MISDDTPNPLPELPAELARLDRELRELSFPERASFGPELEAELARSWRDDAAEAPAARGIARRAVAASLVAVVLTALAVPPARASLAHGLQVLLRSLAEEPTIAVDATVPPAAPAAALPTADRADDGAVETPVSPAAAGESAEDAGRESSSTAAPHFAFAEATYPRLRDPESERRLIRRHYPPRLQQAGVGGTVRLLLWVDSAGRVDNVQVSRGSGVEGLDRAALVGAPSLRFVPATRGGEPVGSWVQFDLVFRPGDPAEALRPPPVAPLDIPPDLEFEFPSNRSGSLAVPAPVQVEAADLLLRAFADDREGVEARLGPLKGLLAAEPPAGVSPLRWRARAVESLQEASARDPDNPAPYLALARIRRRQGAREEARRLFEQGLERVQRSPVSVSPRLVAELHHEYATVLQEAWLGYAHLGRLPAEALAELPCGRAGSDPDDVGALLARNFMCPDALDRLLAESFQPVWEGEGLHAEMAGHLEAAVEAFPAHVGANVALLLDLADDELWYEVLSGARKFAWATGGHPYALLLGGLALHRMGRSEEAADELARGLALLDDADAARLRSTAALGPAAGGDEAFFAALDPVLATPVNERRVEHLARAAYAFLRFGSLEGDEALVWLRYGRPQYVRIFATGGMRTEFWDYGRGPDLTFTRAAGGGVRTLTPESRTYLDELSRVLPHWYGTRARRLYLLPAQVARFRDSGVDRGRVEATVDIPAAMAPAPGDSLQAGLFVLGAEGEILGAERRSVSGERVRLSMATGPRAARVAVELFDPDGNQAASLRLPAVRGLAEGEDVRISDLLLAEAVRPDGAPEFDAPWLVPLSRTDVLPGDQVGVYFEIYDPPPGRETYDLEVHLVAEGSGRRTPVSFRPSGQTLFGATWTRRYPAEAAARAEYLVLDLRGVGSGTYTLEAVVQLDDGTRIVSRRRGLSRSYRPVELRADPLGMIPGA